MAYSYAEKIISNEPPIIKTEGNHSTEQIKVSTEQLMTKHYDLNNKVADENISFEDYSDNVE